MMMAEDIHARLSTLEQGHKTLEKGHENFQQAISAIRDSQEEIAIAVSKIATSLDFAHRSYEHQSTTNERIFNEIKSIRESVSDLPSIREKVGWFVVGCGLVITLNVAAFVKLVLVYGSVT